MCWCGGLPRQDMKSTPVWRCSTSRGATVMTARDECRIKRQQVYNARRLTTGSSFSAFYFERAHGCMSWHQVGGSGQKTLEPGNDTQKRLSNIQSGKKWSHLKQKHAKWSFFVISPWKALTQISDLLMMFSVLIGFKENCHLVKKTGHGKL